MSYTPVFYPGVAVRGKLLSFCLYNSVSLKSCMLILLNRTINENRDRYYYSVFSLALIFIFKFDIKNG